MAATNAAKRKKGEAEKPDTVSRFTVEGKPYEIDMEALTWGEVEDIEVYFDRAYDQIDMESARGAMFIAYMAVRRKRPQITLDYIRGLPVDAMQASEQSERPTEPPAEGGSPDS